VREELIIIMGSTGNMSGGSESRLGAAISTHVPQIVFTVETAEMVHTDEDHNNQLKQVDGEFIGFIIILAEAPVILTAFS
jgi:hypothetical protein